MVGDFVFVMVCLRSLSGRFVHLYALRHLDDSISFCSLNPDTIFASIFHVFMYFAFTTIIFIYISLLLKKKKSSCPKVVDVEGHGFFFLHGCGKSVPLCHLRGMMMMI